MNRRHVVEAQEQVQQALFDYTLNCYAHIPVRIKFSIWNFILFKAVWRHFFIFLIRTSLRKCWRSCRTFTPCRPAARSISISSISTAVHPHRHYSWKCFTPSGSEEEKRKNRNARRMPPDVTYQNKKPGETLDDCGVDRFYFSGVWNEQKILTHFFFFFFLFIYSECECEMSELSER